MTVLLDVVRRAVEMVVCGPDRDNTGERTPQTQVRLFAAATSDSFDGDADVGVPIRAFLDKVGNDVVDDGRAIANLTFTYLVAQFMPMTVSYWLVSGPPLFLGLIAALVCGAPGIKRIIRSTSSGSRVHAEVNERSRVDYR